MAVAEELSEAVISFVGKGRSASPAVNWNGAEGRFGEATRKAAESVVTRLDSIATDWTVEEWDEADDRIRAELSSSYPELNDGALEALVWKFDYDWK